MSVGINLVPHACGVARQRAARRNRWGTITVAAALLLVCGGFARYSIGAHVRQVGERLDHLQARQADLDRQLGLVLRSRAALYEQARGLLALRRTQPLAGQLAAMARNVPEGVLLTELKTDSPPVPAADPARAKTTPAPTASAGDKMAIPTAQPVAVTRTIQLTGFALDHDQLMRWIDQLRRIPNWVQVDLLRAAREPIGAAHAIAFRIECRERSFAP